MTDSLKDVVAEIVAEMRNFAAVAEDCDVTRITNTAPAIRAWADRLLALAAPVVSAADRRDAERYRWLRISANVSWNGYITYENLVAEESERQMMDRAIDNAISPERSGEAS